ncbi:MAG: LytTR family DNA-binding domain-containing protein [Saprospiraceae bacterium]
MVFQRFLHWLRQPFPLLNEGPRIWRMALIGFLFVTLFLFFFRPFGLQPDPEQSGQWFRICVEYGAVTLVTLFAWGWATRALPAIFQEEKWRVWKEILSNLVLVSLIAIANLVYTHFRYDVPLSWRTVWSWQIVTWGVGIFPTLYGIFHKQLRMMQRYATEARSLSAGIGQPQDTSPSESLPITLQGENQGERLIVTVDQIYYLAAADNYVQVFYREKELFKNRMLRSTLKKMEDALVGHPQFFRCHRTFLVNLDKVAQVSGNAQGYRLHLVDLEETVPVSRNLNVVIQQRFGSVS